MTVSTKHHADAALSGHVLAVAAAIVLTIGLICVLGVVSDHAVRQVFGADETGFRNITILALVSCMAAGGLLIRLRIAHARVIRHARFLLPVGTDDLTGLLNRAAFYRAFDRVLEAADRGQPFTLLLLDLDHFKDVNDTFGHHAGDAVLARVASRLRNVCGGEAEIARLGGDEFAVIIQTVASGNHVARACQLIIDEISKPIPFDSDNLLVGVSIGYLEVNQPDAGRDDLMRRADKALYTAKDRGRGHAVAYDGNMDKDVSQRRFFERELRGAVLTGEIDVHLQPIMAADGRRVVGVEALARWNHSYRGLIMPGEFIPVAEDTGLIHQLGATVLKRACQAAVAWPDLFVTVNVSPLQMRRGDFPALVQSVLNETGLSPGRLVLEITEGIMIDDPEKALVAIRAVRSLGVKIALDDFGTGFSSLSYLRKFPIDKLKVDRSFVRDLDMGAEAGAILLCVINVGRALGLEVIAEGVETEEQATFLRNAGCDQMQGFLFGRPMEIGEAGRAIRRGRTVHVEAA
ncbi:putative bifunctional diguanylate cyclase/phosphodiesterase [Phreatobacter aquaticus]|nr:bifunctional diguanylate cyclase/phosphodiesterase [Phreatobacter aquaticus]